jgi:hypothetical protein
LRDRGICEKDFFYSTFGSTSFLGRQLRWQASHPAGAGKAKMLGDMQITTDYKTLFIE